MTGCWLQGGQLAAGSIATASLQLQFGLTCMVPSLLVQPPLEEAQAGLEAAVGTLLADLSAQGLDTAGLVGTAVMCYPTWCCV